MNITSLSLADNIYQDIATGKYILGGVYYQIEIPETPFQFLPPIKAYCAFEPPKFLPCEVEFCIICEKEKSILAKTEKFLISDEKVPDLIQVDVEFPHFIISTTGNHSIGVIVNGIVTQKAPFSIKLVQ